VAREEGARAQKASAGLALFPEASTGFRRMRRADRALPNSEFGMWNSEFFAFFFAIPHSELCIPHLNCPPDP